MEYPTYNEEHLESIRQEERTRILRIISKLKVNPSLRKDEEQMIFGQGFNNALETLKENLV